MDGIDNNYIEKAIENLVDAIGIKDNAKAKKITFLIRRKKIEDGIKEIAKYLGLPIKINLSYVPKGYCANNANAFHSTHLVKTDWRGRGNEGIVAQISIPNCLPMYGTLELNDFPISVRISENCINRSSTFISVMAHELSHIVLHSLRHKEKDNEIYTDITAMILGFSKIMRNGRKVIKTNTSTNYGLFSSTTTTKTEVTTYGYLSDENFRFAFNKINEILDGYKQKKNKLIYGIKKTIKKIKSNKRMISRFQKYLEYVDKNLNCKMPQEDGYKISTFHQTCYIDEFEQVISKTEGELEQFNGLVQNLNHYNEKLFNTIKQCEEKNRIAGNNLDSKHDKLQLDAMLLKKYVPFGHRLKMFIETNFYK